MIGGLLQAKYFKSLNQDRDMIILEAEEEERKERDQDRDEYMQPFKLVHMRMSLNENES